MSKRKREETKTPFKRPRKKRPQDQGYTPPDPREFQTFERPYDSYTKRQERLEFVLDHVLGVQCLVTMVLAYAERDLGFQAFQVAGQHILPLATTALYTVWGGHLSDPVYDASYMSRWLHEQRASNVGDEWVVALYRLFQQTVTVPTEPGTCLTYETMNDLMDYGNYVLPLNADWIQFHETHLNPVAEPATHSCCISAQRQRTSLAELKGSFAYANAALDCNYPLHPWEIKLALGMARVYRAKGILWYLFVRFLTHDPPRVCIPNEPSWVMPDDCYGSGSLGWWLALHGLSAAAQDPAYLVKLFAAYCDIGGLTVYHANPSRTARILF